MDRLLRQLPTSTPCEPAAGLPLLLPPLLGSPSPLMRMLYFSCRRTWGQGTASHWHNALGMAGAGAGTLACSGPPGQAGPWPAAPPLAPLSRLRPAAPSVCAAAG